MHEAGMFPQLEAIRDGKIQPIVAYATYRRTGIKGLPDSNAMETVEAAWKTWSDGVKNNSIPGTKRKARVRVVPRRGTPERRDMGWKQYKTALAAVGAQPYHARRAYEHVLEEAQVSRTRRKLYMGHALRDVTDRYSRADLDAFLMNDRRSLLAYIAEAERNVTANRRSAIRSA